MTLCAIIYGDFVGHHGVELKDPEAYQARLRKNGHTNVRVVELTECPVCTEMHLPPFDGSCLLS